MNLLYYGDLYECVQVGASVILSQIDFLHNYLIQLVFRIYAHVIISQEMGASTFFRTYRCTCNRKKTLLC